MKRKQRLLRFFYWVLIALCPCVLLAALGAALSQLYGSVIWQWAFTLAGMAGGIALAEYSRSRYGCLDYLARFHEAAPHAEAE